jgi:hypothetical protein
MRAHRFRELCRSAFATIAGAVVCGLALAAMPPLVAQACPGETARVAVAEAWDRYAEALEDEVMELDASVWPSRVSAAAIARDDLDRALRRTGMPDERIDRIVDYAARVRDALGTCVAQAE